MKSPLKIGGGCADKRDMSKETGETKMTAAQKKAWDYIAANGPVATRYKGPSGYSVSSVRAMVRKGILEAVTETREYPTDEGGTVSMEIEVAKIPTD